MLTAALGRMTSAAQHAAEQLAGVAEVLRRPRGWRNPFIGIVGTNRFTPHQGAHEMARRRGGQDWLDARNLSRARRGLPVLHQHA